MNEGLPFYRFEQAEALDLVLAAVMAHRLNIEPVWLCQLGDPGSGKTSNLDLFEHKPLPERGARLPERSIILLDKITPRSFISGLDQEGAGLLEQVTNAVILIKELAQVKQMRESGELFANLKRIYDGQVTGRWGSGKEIQWDGFLTIVFCSVVSVSQMDAELGARVLTVRIAGGLTDYRRILAKRKGVEQQRQYVREVLKRTAGAPTEELARAVTMQAKTLAQLRGHVPRNGRTRTREIEGQAIVEEPHRLIRQFMCLACGLGAVWGVPPTDDRIMQTLWRVVGSTCQPNRTAVLEAVIRNDGSIMQATLQAALENGRHMSQRTAEEVCKDLEWLGLVKRQKLTTGRRGSPPVTVHLAEGWTREVRQVFGDFSQDFAIGVRTVSLLPASA